MQPNLNSVEVFMVYSKLHLLVLFSSLLFSQYTKATDNPSIGPAVSAISLCDGRKFVEVKKEQLKIMSFNIRRKGKEKHENRLWKNRLPLIINMLKKTKPDIIGFQEVTQEQIEDLAKSLPDNYKYFGTGRGQSWGGLGTDEATPIFYDAAKLILKKQGTFQMNKSPWYKWIRKHNEHGFLPRICTYGLLALKNSGKQLYIFNTHLDHEFEKARINQLKKILAKTEDNKEIPAIIMGDFNSKLVEPIKKELRKQQFVNTKEIANKIDGPAKTFTGWGDETEKLIDHIVIKNNNGLVVKMYSIVKEENGLYPSDHRPVTVEIVF